MSGEDAAYDPYTMHGNTGGTGEITRWRPAYDNDFAARMLWSVTSNYADANHHPMAVLNGDSSRGVLRVSAAAGNSVALDAAGSSDPDADSLSYKWFFYKEASSYDAAVTIASNSSVSASVQLPAGASGKTLHIVLEVRDDGSPNLYAYRRLIVTVE